jgi:hypothetical protein
MSYEGRVVRLVAYWERDHAFADLASLRTPIGETSPTERAQRGIRSSGKLIHKLLYAQDWQGVQVARCLLS